MIDFFYPPQPTRIWPSAERLIKKLAKTYDSEIKVNGWRLLLFKLPNTLKIFNRHNTVIDIDWKIFLPQFRDIPDNSVLDGELVNFRTKDLKNIMIFWDVPFYNNKDLRELPIEKRRSFLECFETAPLALTTKATAQVYRSEQFTGDPLDFYNTVVARKNALEEGIVLKRKESKYSWHPSRSVDIMDWYKIKKISEDNYRKNS